MGEQVKEMQKFAYDYGFSKFDKDEENPYESIPELGFLIKYYEAGKRMGKILNKEKENDVNQMLKGEK